MSMFTVTNFNASKKIDWLEQLHLLLSNGVALQAALTLLAQNRDYKAISEQIARLVNSGLLLSEAIQRLTAFDEVDRALLDYGERTDNLLLFLQQLIQLKQQQLSTRTRVLTALRYPLIVISSAILITIVLMLTVIPAFARIFADAGQQLPALSQMVFLSANWLLANWRLLLAIVFALLLLPLLARYHSKSRTWLGRLTSRLPVLGGIKSCYDQLLTLQFLRAAAQCDLPVATALQLLPAAALSQRQSAKLQRAQTNLQAGLGLYQALQQSRALPSAALQMIQTGIDSGELAPALLSSQRWLELELKRRIERSIAVLQPSLSLLMGAFIALVVIAIYLPLISIGQAL